MQATCCRGGALRGGALPVLPQQGGDHRGDRRRGASTGDGTDGSPRSAATRAPLDAVLERLLTNAEEVGFRPDGLAYIAPQVWAEALRKPAAA
jgi:hypothetical protein